MDSTVEINSGGAADGKLAWKKEMMMVGAQFQLEEEIVIDILRQLPVMSLVRFKCVSQSWNTFISQPDFKRKHLLHSKKYPKKLFIQLKNEKGDGTFSYFSSSLSLHPTVETDLQLLNCEAAMCYSIRTCYDGLVLLGAPDRPLILWNPSTRELMQLPPEKLSFCDYQKLYGLGYDETCDDYKVFKIVMCYNGDDPTSEILALKSGSWRIIDGGDRGGYFSGQMDLAFVEGAFHWTRNRKSLISFHISNEVYGEVPFPEGIVVSTDGVAWCYQVVTELRGMLSLYSGVVKCDQSGSFHLWVMKDYGVKESWTKLFTIRDSWVTSSIMIIPRYMFEDGEVLVSCRRGMFRISKGPYGPVVREVLDKNDTFQNGYVFTECLISPLGVNH